MGGAAPTGRPPGRDGSNGDLFASFLIKRLNIIYTRRIGFSNVIKSAVVQFVRRSVRGQSDMFRDLSGNNNEERSYRLSNVPGMGGSE